MLIPPYIKPGDKIGIVSTASIIDRKVVEPAIHLLESLGYHVVAGNNLYARHHQFAGSDAQRSFDLQTMLDDPDLNAIICSRGGYGSIRTVENINWKLFLKHPKWIVGFSDITVLHAQLNQLGIASIHGVMPRFFLHSNETTESFRSLMDALTGQKLSYSTGLSTYNRPGIATGQLVGGNLSVLYSLRGTPYDIDTAGKILFIEDLAEYLYHLDRMMMNLKTGGKLASLAGLVVGGFSNMKDNDTPFGKTVEEIILDAVQLYDYPVAFGFPAGHQQENFALKAGMPATLKVIGDKAILQQ